MEDKQVYETPQVVTYTAEEILEELGPAQASNYGWGSDNAGGGGWGGGG